MSYEKTRVMIVDDQELFAVGLRVVIESRAPNLEVVAMATNGREAVKLARELKPDIILMDVRMPEMNGVEATRLIHEKYPEIKILILTTFDDEEYVQDSLKNGAIGYLLKNRPAEELVDSIRVLQKGIMQIDPAVSGKALGFVRVKEERDNEIFARLASLTQRELQILDQMVQAKRIVQIAGELEIAEQTVRNHISNIYFKLDIHDRMEIVKYISPIKDFLQDRRDGLY